MHACLTLVVWRSRKNSASKPTYSDSKANHFNTRLNSYWYSWLPSRRADSPARQYFPKSADKKETIFDIERLALRVQPPLFRV